MAKKYDIHYFSYVNDEKGMNTLNGTKKGKSWEEVLDEYPVVCFNGFAYFASKFPNGSIHYFGMSYPKYNQLTDDDKYAVSLYCGFYPNGGEYGVICGALGDVKEFTASQFKEICRDYPVKASDKKEVEWFNF